MALHEKTKQRATLPISNIKIQLQVEFHLQNLDSNSMSITICDQVWENRSKSHIIFVFREILI